MGDTNDNIGDNIEDKIKNIIKNKLHSADNLDENTLDLINKLFEIFPKLKNDSINKNNLPKKNNPDTDEIVLEEFIHNNIVYYKDVHNGIWDNLSELVGIIYKGQAYIF